MALACEGMRPVVAIFLQRAYDQIITTSASKTCSVFSAWTEWNCRRWMVPPSGYVRHCYLRVLQYGLDGSQNEAELQQMVVTGVNYIDGPPPQRSAR